MFTRYSTKCESEECSPYLVSRCEDCERPFSLQGVCNARHLDQPEEGAVVGVAGQHVQHIAAWWEQHLQQGQQVSRQQHARAC